VKSHTTAHKKARQLNGLFILSRLPSLSLSRCFLFWWRGLINFVNRLRTV